MFFSLLCFLFFTLLFAFILFFLSTIITYKNNTNLNKFDLYECGFKAFDTARQPININFFLIGVLFIIFDIETVYLVPWLLTFTQLTFNALFTVLFFLFLLIIGYIYELKEGLLDWSVTKF